MEAVENLLSRPLGPNFVSEKLGHEGHRLACLEAGEVIGLANSIFGFSGWSHSLTELTVDFVDHYNGHYYVGVSARVKVELRGGAHHEDVGYGVSEGLKSKALSLEKARKEAVSDGIKRALKSFGNALGNCFAKKDYIHYITHANSSINPGDLLDEESLSALSEIRKKAANHVQIDHQEYDCNPNKKLSNSKNSNSSYCDGIINSNLTNTNIQFEMKIPTPPPSGFMDPFGQTNAIIDGNSVEMETVSRKVVGVSTMDRIVGMGTAGREGDGLSTTCKIVGLETNREAGLKNYRKKPSEIARANREKQAKQASREEAGTTVGEVWIGAFHRNDAKMMASSGKIVDMETINKQHACLETLSKVKLSNDRDALWKGSANTEVVGICNAIDGAWKGAGLENTNLGPAILENTVKKRVGMGINSTKPVGMVTTPNAEVVGFGTTSRVPLELETKKCNAGGMAVSSSETVRPSKKNYILVTRLGNVKVGPTNGCNEERGKCTVGYNGAIGMTTSKSWERENNKDAVTLSGKREILLYGSSATEQFGVEDGGSTSRERINTDKNKVEIKISESDTAGIEKPCREIAGFDTSSWGKSSVSLEQGRMNTTSVCTGFEETTQKSELQAICNGLPISGNNSCSSIGNGSSTVSASPSNLSQILKESDIKNHINNGHISKINFKRNSPNCFLGFGISSPPSPILGPTRATVESEPSKKRKKQQEFKKKRRKTEKIENKDPDVKITGNVYGEDDSAYWEELMTKQLQDAIVEEQQANSFALSLGLVPSKTHEKFESEYSSSIVTTAQMSPPVPLNYCSNGNKSSYSGKMDKNSVIFRKDSLIHAKGDHSYSYSKKNHSDSYKKKKDTLYGKTFEKGLYSLGKKNNLYGKKSNAVGKKENLSGKKTKSYVKKTNSPGKKDLSSKVDKNLHSPGKETNLSDKTNNLHSEDLYSSVKKTKLSNKKKSTLSKNMNSDKKPTVSAKKLALNGKDLYSGKKTAAKSKNLYSSSKKTYLPNKKTTSHAKNLSGKKSTYLGKKSMVYDKSEYKNDMKELYMFDDNDDMYIPSFSFSKESKNLYSHKQDPNINSSSEPPSNSNTLTNSQSLEEKKFLVDKVTNSHNLELANPRHSDNVNSQYKNSNLQHRDTGPYNHFNTTFSGHKIINTSNSEVTISHSQQVNNCNNPEDLTSRNHEEKTFHNHKITNFRNHGDLGSPGHKNLTDNEEEQDQFSWGPPEGTKEGMWGLPTPPSGEETGDFSVALASYFIENIPISPPTRRKIVPFDNKVQPIGEGNSTSYSNVSSCSEDGKTQSTDSKSSVTSVSTNVNAASFTNGATNTSSIDSITSSIQLTGSTTNAIQYTDREANSTQYTECKATVTQFTECKEIATQYTNSLVRSTLFRDSNTSTTPSTGSKMGITRNMGCDASITHLTGNETGLTIVTNTKISTTVPENSRESVTQYYDTKTSLTIPTASKTSFTSPTVNKTNFTPPTVSKPSVISPTVSKPSVTLPAISKTILTPPTISKTSLTPPTISKTSLTPPTISKTSLIPPTISKTSLTPPSISKTSLITTAIIETSVTPPNGFETNATCPTYIKISATPPCDCKTSSVLPIGCKTSVIPLTVSKTNTTPETVSKAIATSFTDRKTDSAQSTGNETSAKQLDDGKRSSTLSADSKINAISSSDNKTSLRPPTASKSIEIPLVDCKKSLAGPVSETDTSLSNVGKTKVTPPTGSKTSLTPLIGSKIIVKTPIGRKASTKPPTDVKTNVPLYKTSTSSISDKTSDNQFPESKTSATLFTGSKTFVTPINGRKNTALSTNKRNNEIKSTSSKGYEIPYVINKAIVSPSTICKGTKIQSICSETQISSAGSKTCANLPSSSKCDVKSSIDGNDEVSFTTFVKKSSPLNTSKHSASISIGKGSREVASASRKTMPTKIISPSNDKLNRKCSVVVRDVMSLNNGILPQGVQF